MVIPVETSLTAEELFDRPPFTPDDTPYWPGEADSDEGIQWWQEYDEMPRGKYFIGDPCHVVDDYFSLTEEKEVVDVEGVGRMFWVSIDGLQQATDPDTSYCCDSMAIGITCVDHLTPGHWAALKALGRLIEWTNGDPLPADEDEEWEKSTVVGIDYAGNVFLGSDWWFTSDFIESSQLPESFSHLKNGSI
jgi:hypothetical protein